MFIPPSNYPPNVNLEDIGVEETPSLEEPKDNLELEEQLERIRESKIR